MHGKWETWKGKRVKVGWEELYDSCFLFFYFALQVKQSDFGHHFCMILKVFQTNEWVISSLLQKLMAGEIEDIILQFKVAVLEHVHI